MHQLALLKRCKKENPKILIDIETFRTILKATGFFDPYDYYKYHEKDLKTVLQACEYFDTHPDADYEERLTHISKNYTFIDEKVKEEYRHIPF